MAGPASFITCSSSLHPKHKSNVNVKYADDAYLLIGSQNINTAAEEFSNITTWAAKNNLLLNHTNRPTKEMIIRKIGITKLVPAIIPGAIRVESLCILRVSISSDLKMDQHINRVLSSACHQYTHSARFDRRDYLQTLSTSSPKPPLYPAPCTHRLHGGDLPAYRTETRSKHYEPYEMQRVPLFRTSKC